MSLPQPPKPAKLVIGMFMKDKALVEEVTQTLISHFGPVDLISPWFSFDFTDYYSREMGKPLFRRVCSFSELIDQTSLPDVKIVTNRIENDHFHNGLRSVNIDPGYLLFERFVLATGKNYSHRIYIGKGIYADLTLIYMNGGFQTLPWTYPDYAAENMTGFLIKVRSKYVVDLKKMANNENYEDDDRQPV